MEHRVQFDFVVEFTNGGGIIAGEDISDQALADYIVQDMRLLMVGKVTILNKAIIQEKHKRNAIDNPKEEKKWIDLSHTIFDGLITHRGLPAPLFCDYMSREESQKSFEDGTTFQIGKVEMIT